MIANQAHQYQKSSKRERSSHKFPIAHGKLKDLAELVQISMGSCSHVALPKVQKVSESTEPKTWDDVEYEEEEWYMTISKPAQQEEEMKEDVDKLATAPDSDDEDDEVYEDPLGIVKYVQHRNVIL